MPQKVDLLLKPSATRIPHLSGLLAGDGFVGKQPSRRARPFCISQFKSTTSEELRAIRLIRRSGNPRLRNLSRARHSEALQRCTPAVGLSKSRRDGQFPRPVNKRPSFWDWNRAPLSHPYFENWSILGGRAIQKAADVRRNASPTSTGNTSTATWSVD